MRDVVTKMNLPKINKLFVKIKLNKSNYYVMRSDLNAKYTDWKNPNNNLKGIALKNWIKGKNIE